MPTNLGSPSIGTSCVNVGPSLHDAGAIGPGNCSGSIRIGCDDQAGPRFSSTQVGSVCRIPTYHTRLCAITWTASQAPFGMLRIGGEAPRGEMVQSNAVLEVSDGILDLGVAAMIGLEIQGVPPDRGRYGLKSGCDIAWEGAPPSGILVVRPPDAGDPRCAFPANAIRCKKRLKRIYLTSPSHN